MRFLQPLLSFSINLRNWHFTHRFTSLSAATGSGTKKSKIGWRDRVYKTWRRPFSRAISISFFPRRCKNLPLSSHFCGEDGEGGAVQERMMYPRRTPLMKSLNSWKRIGTSSIKMEMRHWITHSTHQPVTIPSNRISDRRLSGIYTILKGLQKLSSVTLWLSCPFHNSWFSWF